MRREYLVCYDVSNPKRLQTIHKRMLGFGDPLQYSVFLCSLSDTEKVLMEGAVHDTINHREDCVLVIDLGASGGNWERRFEFIGMRKDIPERGPVVV